MAKTFPAQTAHFMRQTASCSHATCQAMMRSAESMRPRHTQNTRSQCAFRIKTVTP